MKERRREKEEERKRDEPVPLWGEVREKERFLHPEKAPHHQGDQLGQKGSFGGLLEESTSTGLWQAGQSETYTDGL